MEAAAAAAEEKKEIRKRDYKHLLNKYKNVEAANDFFKLQLQDLNARLKIEQKEKERLHQDLLKARGDICNRKPNGSGVSYDADVEEVTSRLKEAYKKLEEEFELRDQLSKDLEYTKTMLLAEGRTRSLLETRNSQLERELRLMRDGGKGVEPSEPNDAQVQLEETKKRLEEEMNSRLALQQSKDKIEAELEDLTKSLFEEANHMVSTEAREKYELLQSKKRLEQELELAKSKIQLDEKLLQNMKNRFVTIEHQMQRKLHRRTSSSTSAPNNLGPNAFALFKFRPHSSHPNLVTLNEETRMPQISPASSPGPSSPISTPIQSPEPQITIQSPEPQITIQSPESQLTIQSPEPELTIQSSTPSASPSQSPADPPLIIKTSPPMSPAPVHVTSPPIPIHSQNPLPITPPSSQPYELSSSATTNSDDTSEMSQQEGSLLDENEWGVDWLLEDGVANGEDQIIDGDDVLIVEAHGRIDLQAGLSQFVQLVASTKKSEDPTGRLIDRVMRDDLGPCLKLRGHEDRAYRKLLEAVWHNKIFIEPLTAPVSEVCAGCGVESSCRWRVRMGSSHEWKVMGDLCRERIARSCDFYAYLRNLKQGLVKKTLPNIYKEFLRLRLMMNFARICAG